MEMHCKKHRTARFRALDTKADVESRIEGVLMGDVPGTLLTQIENIFVQKEGSESSLGIARVVEVDRRGPSLDGTPRSPEQV